MKHLQVYLSEADMKRLSDWAKHSGWTKSHAARVAIRAIMHASEDAFLSSSGMIEGLPADMSVRLDAYLNDTYRSF